ncbi:hypothetical protein AtNW77_Chr2g0259071 [Arabidopsis thaliana]
MCIHDSSNLGYQSYPQYRKHVEVGESTQCNSPDYSRANPVEFIDVSTTTLTPDLWKMAPRRQCCEIVNSEEDSESVINVKIRHFNPLESVTPQSKASERRMDRLHFIYRDYIVLSQEEMNYSFM